MPPIPLNAFLSHHPSESLDMIADGLRLVGTCLAVAGDDNMLLAYDELRGLSRLARALEEAVRYESERYPKEIAGRDGPIAAWNAAVDDRCT